ncbi:hypothetical protein H5410_013835 [Solanum commersonii]|uniref:Uncharacterized protein n=1 Tax=Solanum commersonii TaxID=4109 RepID=A0A9J5ZPH4_SOLCO|nr:hypothetical protein H5410_013835 [Solanum commersonii]
MYKRRYAKKERVRMERKRGDGGEGYRIMRYGEGFLNNEDGCACFNTDKKGPSMVLTAPVRNEFGGSLCLLSANYPLLCFKFVKSGAIDIVHELLLYSLFLFHFPFLFWRRACLFSGAVI